MTKHEFEYPKTDAEVAANRWEEITEERYFEALECLPPARWSGNAFAVGEPMNDMLDGRTVYTVCVGPVGGKYYTKPYPLKGFDRLLFERQIEQQVRLDGYVGRFARSIESGWLGKVVGVELQGDDVMLRMQGVNELCRMIAGGTLDANLEDDDTQWFAPEDVKFVELANGKDAGDLAARTVAALELALAQLTKPMPNALPHDLSVIREVVRLNKAK